MSISNKIIHPAAESSYFSLSTNDGHRAGRILVAQSSSVKTSEVAASASRAALRACTKGSRNEREKADTSTFCLVWSPVSGVVARGEL